MRTPKPRRSKARRPEKGRVLPAPLIRRIDEAGASAYAWHDAELAEHLDPTGRWRRLERTLTTSATWAAIVVIIVAAFFAGLANGIVAVIALFLGAFAGRFRREPWWAWGICAVAAAWSTVTSGAPGNVLVAALVIAVVLAPRARRDASAATLAAVAAVSSALTPETAPGAWASAIVVGLAAAGSIYWTGPHHMPQPWRRLGAGDLTALIPHPPTRVPRLVQWGARKKMGAIPQEIRRKQAGAVGERKTAVALLGMPRFHGTAIAHDVLIPNAKTANTDHVVLARSGLYIIDTKQFGRDEDPGVVTADPQTGEIIHRSGQGNRSVDKSLETAAWAAASVAAVLGMQGRTRVILAVHKAAVAHGLVTHRHGVPVEVLPAAAVGDWISSAPAALSSPELASARFRMGRLQAASSNMAARVTAPVGATAAARDELRIGARRSLAEPVEIAVSGREASSRDGDATVGDRDAAWAAPSRAPDVADPAEAPEPPRGPHVPTAPTARVYPVEVPVPSARERLRQRWEQMIESQPAAPDDAPAEVRDVWRGTPIMVLVTSDTGSVSTMDAVAMTGPCQGVTGSFIWFCAPEQYRVFTTTKEPVAISTISTERIMKRSTSHE